MVTLTIDGRNCTVPEGTTILQAAASVGIYVPTLCYLKDINEISACRVCVVEVEGFERLVPACTEKVAEGMTVFTNSHRAKTARETNLKLILSQHDGDCTTCVRNRNCQLQDLASWASGVNLSFIGSPALYKSIHKILYPFPPAGSRAGRARSAQKRKESSPANGSALRGGRSSRSVIPDPVPETIPC